MSKSHYTVLSIPTSTSSTTLSPTLLKTAYHRALLLHHPDKSTSPSHKALYTVDEISRAYKVLSDPHTRAEYDRELKLQARNKLGDGKGHTGLETVDLDDLKMVEERDGDKWTRDCRCGRTYVVTETQLEQEAEKGEVYVPCEGCSLWLRVLFQVEEDG